MRFLLFMVLALGSLSAYTDATADGPKLEKTFKAWNVFSFSQNGQKICYTSTKLKKEEGSFRRRSDPYFLVTYRGNGVSEISASSGYPYQVDSEVELNVDGKRYQTTLFTSSETPKVAWAKSAEEDKMIIKGLKRGEVVTIKGNSRLKTHSKDTYSLLGFTKAYNYMLDSCR